MEYLFVARLFLYVMASMRRAAVSQDYFSNDCFDGYSDYYSQYSYSYSSSAGSSLAFDTVSFSSFDWYGDDDEVYFFESNDTSFHLCPAVHLCSFDGADPPVCSCHPSCVHFKTCCYDQATFNASPNQTDGGQSQRRTSSLGEWKADDFVCVETFAPLRGHHMIGKCPLTWQDDYVRQKCENVSTLYPDQDLSDPLSIIPVVGPGNVTFRNGFCAICHSVELTLLEPWKLDIHCPQSKFDNLEEDVEGIFKGLGSECRLNLVPPSDVQGLSVLPCFPRNVDVGCHDDSHSPAESESVQNLQQNCLTYLAPLCLSDGNVYKNPECVLCNYPNKKFPYGFRGLYCLGLTPLLSFSPATNLKHSVGPGFDKVVPLSVIFDFSSSSGLRFEKDGVTYEEKGRLCGQGQVLDPFSGRCVTLSCPEGYYFVMGDCSPISEDKTYCRHTNSTPEATITADFRASLNDSESLYHRYTQICISKSLNIPNQLVIRHMDGENDTATHGGGPEESVSPSTHNVDEDMLQVKFFVNRSSLNLKYLIKNMLNYSIGHIDLDIDIQEDVTSAFGLLGKVCSNLVNVRFRYECEDQQTSESRCPSFLRKETAWNIIEKNDGLSAVHLSRTDTTRPLEDVSVLIDVFIDDHEGVANVSKEVSFCDELTCPSIEVDASLFQTVLVNGDTVLRHVTDQGIIVPSEKYRYLKDGSVKICSSILSDKDNEVVADVNDQIQRTYAIQSLLSTVGICISVICLWGTLITYFLFPSLRRSASNKLTMSFCFFLSLSQASSLILGLPTFWPIVCSAVAISTHYLWLVTFTTTSVIGFDLDQAFAWSPMTHSQGEGNCRVLKYLSFCYGLPLVVITPGIFLQHFLQDESPIRYGNSRVCWITDPQWVFYGIGIPLAICMSCNFFFFVHTIRAINDTRKNSAIMNDSGRQKPFQDVLVFLKISLQMGFTWATSFIANLTGSPIAWYIFIILNSFQGVLIFVAFMLSTRVRKIWMQKLGCSTAGRHNNTTTSTRRTDQSESKL